MSRWVPRCLAAALLLLGVARISTTWRVLSQTHDEPAHLGCGMEWLSRHTYNYEPQHPPLTRVAGAVGLWLGGARTIGMADMYDEGNALFYANGRLEQNLAAARAGIALFYLLAGWTVYLWGRWLLGEWGGATAAGLLSVLPPILGHAGLVTTDMGLAATLPLALYTWCRFLDEPGGGRAAAAGAALALAVLSKFTSLLFFTAGAGAICLVFLLTRRGVPLPWKRFLLLLALFFVTLTITIWAGYLFSFDTVHEANGAKALLSKIGTGTPLRDTAQGLLRLPLPAGKLLWGIGSAFLHVKLGHGSFLLGEIRHNGWWYFFPVVLAVKTPVPFLLLALTGLGLLLRGGWRAAAPAAAAVAILLVCLPSTINLGVRHILPIYPLLAIAGAAALGALWRWRRAAVALPLVWLAVNTVQAHPDHLPWFNELAGAHPERILVESDLDWGQDLTRLRNTLRARGATSVSLAYFGQADPVRHGIPGVRRLERGQPATGWVAVSLHELVLNPAGYVWLEGVPSELVGRSVRLYHLPPLTAP